MRRALELRVGPVLVLLARLPQYVVFLSVMGLLVGGLLLGGFAGTFMVTLVGLLLALQIYFAWPVLAPPQRLMRLAVLVLIAVAASR